ncbi:MAG TPA: hypothetical protein VME46_12465 [Acidimicrobiales bacterium]|nr:hypothetical protein [Acidimicrobiales bacterium]
MRYIPRAQGPSLMARGSYRAEPSSGQISLRAVFALTGIACAALGLPASPAGATSTVHPAMTVCGATSGPRPQAPANGAPGTASGHWTYPGLCALIRASYYAAYRRDPKPQDLFNVSAGLPESDIEEPGIDDAGVIYGRTAGTNSYWVVADICFRSPTGCEDMGAFQVFHRSGPNGDFAYGTFDICSIPPPLARLWFPGGRGPMGTHCPETGSGATAAQVAAALSAATPGMGHDIVAISGGRYEAAVYDKAAHIDFWEYSAAKWAEVGRSTYPTLPPSPSPLDSVVGRQLTGMSDATFIATGIFTGDSTGQALAFGKGPRGWGTIAWEPGNVLVPTGNGSTNNTTPGIYFKEQFSGGQLETTSLNPYFSTATGAEFPLNTYWSWDVSASHFVDARDNSFTSSSKPKWGKSLKSSGPRLTQCSKTPLTGTYEVLAQVGTPTWSARLGEGLPVAVHAVEANAVGGICDSQVLPGTMPIVVNGATAGDKNYVLITAPAWLLDIPSFGSGPLTVRSAPVGTTPWVVPPSLHIATIVSDLGVSAQNAYGGNPESPVDAVCTFEHGVIVGFVVNGSV